VTRPWPDCCSASTRGCVIGDRVRRDLFGFEPALGRPLKVNDQWLTVVGVLEEPMGVTPRPGAEPALPGRLLHGHHDEQDREGEQQ